MRNQTFVSVGILLVLALLVMSACSPQPAATQPAAATPTEIPTPAQQTYSDPFAYCAAVGNINKPDARYTGPSMTDEIREGFLAAAGLEDSSMPSDVFERMTIWRCMDGQVYACNFGANLPCDSQANTDTTPTQAMNEFCQANPGSDFIPMAVTGHDTIYSWRCAGESAELGEQIAEVDASGYLANIWYAVRP